MPTLSSELSLPFSYPQHLLAFSRPHLCPTEGGMGREAPGGFLSVLLCSQDLAQSRHVILVG